MKRVFLVSSAMLVMAFSAKIFAQKKSEFKPFKVDVSAGYAIPIGGTGAKGGALFAVEPKYAVMPQLSVGIRIVELAVTIAGIDFKNGTSNSTASAKAAASFLVTGDYYFNNNNFRPFAGAGAGIFIAAGATASSTNTNVAEGAQFGGMVRGGFEYKHFRFGVEYNAAGKSEAPASTATANDGYFVRNSYVGIKLGICIGGGRRK